MPLPFTPLYGKFSSSIEKASVTMTKPSGRFFFSLGLFPSFVDGAPEV
jgi:hypothetical protein